MNAEAEVEKLAELITYFVQLPNFSWKEKLKYINDHLNDEQKVEFEEFGAWFDSSFNQ